MLYLGPVHTRPGGREDSKTQLYFYSLAKQFEPSELDRKRNQRKPAILIQQSVPLKRSFFLNALQTEGI